MPREQTANYDLWKPEVGSVGTPQWSEDLNTDMDLLDAALLDLQTQIDTLAPDAPEGLTERIESLERMKGGKRLIRRVEITGSQGFTLGEDVLGDPSDVLWITATGSGAKVVTLSTPTPDQVVDGTADGTFVVVEGYLVIQNLGSGSISYTGLNSTLGWRDGDGGGIGAQSTPGGQLRFYKYWAFASADSSESPPSNRIYLWRLAV